jgi:hypothetical protein
MAPVAARVAQAEEDRHVALTCLGERLLPPLPPVHQVAGIAARPGETVLHTFRELGVFSDECSLDITVFVEVGRR